MEQWVIVLGGMVVGGLMVYAVTLTSWFKGKGKVARPDHEIFAIAARPVIRIEYDQFDERNSKFLCDMKIALDRLLDGTNVLYAEGPKKEAPGKTEGVTEGEKIETEESDSDNDHLTTEEDKDFKEVQKEVQESEVEDLDQEYIKPNEFKNSVI